MLSTRKSMTNLMETAEGPFLIHFRYWFQTKYREGIIIKILFGKRPPIIIKNYLPGEKYVILDIASRSSMPLCKIQCSDGNLDIDLKKYQPGMLKQHSLNLGKLKLVFTFQLLTSTAQISNVYLSQKIDDEEKYHYCESVNDIIRSEAEFLSKFQKDTQLQDIKKAEKVQSELESKLSAQLASIKPIDFNLKNLILIFFLFFLIGYFVSSPEPEKRKIKKKLKKQKKIH